MTITGNVKLQLHRQDVRQQRRPPITPPATKKFETFDLTDQPPYTSVTGPPAALSTTKTFTVTGTTTDDIGVVSVTLTLRRRGQRATSRTTAPSAHGYNSFTIRPRRASVPRAPPGRRRSPSPTRAPGRPRPARHDTGGHSSLDTADRTWIVTATRPAPVGLDQLTRAQ